MYTEKRRQSILNYLASVGHASTLELVQATGSSEATIRRDIKEMDSQGLVHRIHGGCVLVNNNSGLDEKSFETQNNICQRVDPDIKDKDILAQKSVSLIRPGDIVFIGAGMTCNLICHYISIQKTIDLTIITTNITSILEFKNNPNINVSLLGGSIHFGENHIETLDNYNTSSLQKLYFDKVFITVDGVDINYGYSIQNPAQIPLYNYLLNNAKSCYILVNKSKFDKRAFTHFCDLDKIQYVITNNGINEKYLNYFNNHNINIIV